jgi:Zn-dependent protease
LHGFDIADVLVQYVCLLFSLCFHEAAHAIMADRCGDPSARLLGRATLNPLAHIDPIGTVVLPLLMMTSGIPFLFGWAKPVPFNPRNLRDIRRDPAWIGLAGPGANLLLAVTAAIVLRVLVLVLGMPASVEMLFENPLTRIAFTLVMINLALMVFNLIPVPPLDGSHLLHAVLPPQGQRVLEQIGPFGILIAIVLASRILTGPLIFLMHAVLAFAFWGQS